MHQVNKSLILPLIFVLCLVVGLSGQQQQQQQAPPSTPIGSEEPSAPPVMMPQTQAPAQTQQPAQQTPQQQAPAQQAPGQTGQAPAQQPANQPGNTVQVPRPQQGREADSQEGGVFVFKKQVEEVTLHATVVDDRQKLVTNLDKGSFTVYEDGQPQQITSFRREDIPVSLGILIDNSGSMRDKRPAVNQAALNLVRSSNPADQVFIVNFNEDYYLDQDYTSNVNLLKESLDKIESRGGTAMYDALVASADHLMKTAKLDKKALLVVTDGEDNASRESLEAAIRRLAVDGGPTVYTIGILGEEGKRSEKVAKRALTAVSERTGGVSFFPRDLSEVDAITRQVAKDIRNQYSIGYKPTNPQQRGGYRTVKVEAKADGYKRLQVRTRSGYYAGTERAAAGNP
jgi:Ca-activated chloride channel family protein